MKTITTIKSLATVVEIGIIYLSLFIILKKVLHVPMLTYNFISISELTRDLEIFILAIKLVYFLTSYLGG